MRILARVLGTLLLVCGVVALIIGIAVMAIVGREDRIPLGEQQWSSTGAAVVSGDGLFSVMGPTLHVEATSEKPLFIGVGHTDDVTDYLDKTECTVISSWEPPSAFGTDQISGESKEARAKPDGLDWWVAQSTGDGSATLDWTMTDGHYSFVIMNADGSPAVDTDATLAIRIEGLFDTALLVAIGGLLGVAAGVASYVFTRRRKQVTAS
ncbi:hypothetical protein ACQBAR_03195 [Propionibacteriaceae bacterium Y1685]|uniref:hypothetical protein n=1 Tax=Microlunatus sp. Y1700 TaxID=3418487 RepID=UPI003B7886B1